MKSANSVNFNPDFGYGMAIGGYDYDNGYPQSGSAGIMTGWGGQVKFEPLPTPSLDLDSLADKLWEKLQNRPVIIPCPYCRSHNAFDNPVCVQCGGPLGA